jgi:hypothetical protein
MTTGADLWKFPVPQRVKGHSSIELDRLDLGNPYGFVDTAM